MRVIFSFCLLIAAAAADYCALCINHIGCNNPGTFSSNCPKDAVIIAISSSLRATLLDDHNKIRNRVAGGQLTPYKPAARMATMQWDNELAKLAELNVKQCVMRHDGCRKTKNFKYAGQNLAISGWRGTTRDVTTVAKSHIDMWYQEYKKCNMTYINKYSSPSNGDVIGHFTQLVNDKATHVGCAILRMTQNGYLYQLMACNYARTNILGLPIYTSSKTPGSGCTTGKHASYPFLCTVKESINPNAI